MGNTLIELNAFNEIVKGIEEIKQLLTQKPKDNPAWVASQIEKVWLDKKEVCKILRISERTLQKYRDNNVIPFTRIGNKIQYKTEDVKAHFIKHYHPIVSKPDRL
ncbi:helix-turn-helix domain-containing protein [Bacteroidota bacterium]